MKNVAINLGLGLAVLAGVNLFTSGIAAASPEVPTAPSSLHFVCSSSEIGVVDIKLNNPQQLTIGPYIHYYDMTVTQSNLKGTILAQNTYDKSDENFARARLSIRDPNMPNLPFPTNIDFTIPSAGQIDWNQHPNDCHISAPAPGVNFELNLETMNVEPDHVPSIKFSIQNPRVEERLHSDIGFGRWVEYLNNQQCSTSADYRRAIQTVQCKQIN